MVTLGWCKSFPILLQWSLLMAKKAIKVSVTGKSHVEVDTNYRIHACVIFQFLTIQIWECLDLWLRSWWSREPKPSVHNTAVHEKMKTRDWSLLLCSRDLMKITVVLGRKALWRLKSVSSILFPLTRKNKTAPWHQIWHNYVVMRQHIKAAAVASALFPLMLASDVHWGVVGMTECKKILNAKRNVWYLFRIL